MKNAVLVVSVGTTKIEAIEYTSKRLLHRMEKEYPEAKCYLAFSNERILNKMKQKQSDTFLGLEEALEQILEDGVETLLVQPTYLLKGLENDGMLQVLEAYRSKFSFLKIGKPLLSSKEDYSKALAAICSYADLAEDEALVLVGHGSALSDNTYQNLEYTAYVQGQRNIFVGTISDEKSQRMTLRKVKAAGFKRVCLMPLLFVVAHHGMKDIFAEESSWNSALKEEGYVVTAKIAGLGEMNEIIDLFIEHLKAAER